MKVLVPLKVYGPALGAVTLTTDGATGTGRPVSGLKSVSNAIGGFGATIALLMARD